MLRNRDQRSKNGIVFSMAECIHEIFAWYEAGKLKPAPAVIYPLEKFAQALLDIQDRRVRGRIVLVPNP